jgi:DDE family transposase
MEKLNAQINDQRLNQRAEIIFNRMHTMQTISLRKLGGNRAGEVGGGRFFNNPKVTNENLLKGKQQKLAEVVRGRHVLAIQDTSEINYSSHRNRTQGLGELRYGNKGLLMHPSIAVDGENAALLGAVNVKTWARPKKDTENEERDHKQLITKEKESIRWIEEANVSKDVLSSAAMVTVISDRECDFYRFLDKVPDERTHILIRAAQDRKLDADEVSDLPDTLFIYMDNLPIKGVYEFEGRIPNADKVRRIRKTTFEVRFSEVTIKRPDNCKDGDVSDEVDLYAIDVRECEECVPTGAAPLHWRLLTTHAIETVEQACVCIGWYKHRWQIEEIFRLCKQDGLRIEDSELETADGLMRLITMTVLVAVQIFQLMQVRSGEIDRKASEVFEENEIEALKSLNKNLEGKTEKQKNPYIIGHLAWAAWIIARLGGWNGYVRERKPGPITFFDGLKILQGILIGWKLATKDVCIP